MSANERLERLRELHDNESYSWTKFSPEPEDIGPVFDLEDTLGGQRHFLVWVRKGDENAIDGVFNQPTEALAYLDRRLTPDEVPVGIVDLDAEEEHMLLQVRTEPSLSIGAGGPLPS